MVRHLNTTFLLTKKHMPIFRILAGLGLELKYWKILISDRILEPKKKDQFCRTNCKCALNITVLP